MSDHATILGKFQQREFLVEDRLAWIPSVGEFMLAGEIGCRGNLIITVEKTLEVLEEGNDPLVQTIEYSYNASVRSAGSFLRYDNAHPHPGHSTPHHRHDMDWRNNSEELPNSPVCIGYDWPTLGEFLEEVEKWYWVHRDQLPDPDGIPKLGLR